MSNATERPTRGDGVKREQPQSHVERAIGSRGEAKARGGREGEGALEEGGRGMQAVYPSLLGGLFSSQVASGVMKCQRAVAVVVVSRLLQLVARAPCDADPSSRVWQKGASRPLGAQAASTLACG